MRTSSNGAFVRHAFSFRNISRCILPRAHASHTFFFFQWLASHALYFFYSTTLSFQSSHDQTSYATIMTHPQL
jgi:hypothetical protein